MASGEPFKSSTFAKSLLGRMIRRESATQRARGPFFEHWLDGLHPTLRSVGEQMVREDTIRLHPSVAALNSSMVFGFNLFMPFRFGDAHPLGVLLSTAIGRELVVEKVVFEFAGPTAILAEVAGSEPIGDEPFTASDVAVFVRDETGRHGLVLIEVKLTERGFSTCSGADSRGNRRRDVCGSAERLFTEPDACYLRKPYRAVRERRYWRIFEEAHGSLRAAFPGFSLGEECPFRGDSQQLMRNHALLLGVQQAGVVDFGAFALVHHDANPDVVPPWDRYAASVADRSVLFRIEASEIARAVAAPIGPWLEERYLLGSE